MKNTGENLEDYHNNFYKPTFFSLGMQIYFNELDYAFNFLDYKPKKSSRKTTKRKACLSFSSVGLHSPLEFCELEFTRKAENYCAEFYIISSDESAFNDISRLIPIKGWKQSNAHGCGYFIDSSEDAAISVSSYIPGERVIAIGNHGAIPRKIASFEEFSGDMSSLEHFVNIYTNICFENLLKSEKIEALPQHKIYLTS
jgi:hypothetical protein